MKGKEIINRITQAEMPDMEKLGESCIRIATQENITKSAKTCKSENRRYYQRPAFILATAVVLAVVISFGVINFPLNNTSIQTPGNQTVYSFSVVACAAERDSTKTKFTVDEKTETEIKPDLQFMLPFCRIIRGEKISDGDIVKGYECEIEGGIAFGVKGENIDSVKFTSKTGDFTYQDVVERDRLNKKGDLVICSFPVKESLAHYKDLDKVKELWDNGHFENIKKKYFSGKSTNLADYQLGASQYPDQAKKGVWEFRVLQHYTGNPPYIQDAPSVTVKYYPELGQRSFDYVSWNPTQAMKEVMKDKPLKYEELPGDVITIEVTFEDGKIETKTISLSFETTGRVTADLGVLAEEPVSDIPEDANPDSFMHYTYKRDEDVNAPVKDLDLSEIKNATTELAKEYGVQMSGDYAEFAEKLAEAMLNENNKNKVKQRRGFFLEQTLMRNADIDNGLDLTRKDDKLYWCVKVRYPNGRKHAKVGLVTNAISTSYYDANTGEFMGGGIESLDDAILRGGLRNPPSGKKK